jgi:6-phospho-beta-glucosidase
VKLTVLGGGGVRIPALIRAVVGGRPTTFDRIDLFEPDEHRRASVGRLSVELAAALGRPETVGVTGDIEEALTDTDYVFSAIRVGGDKGRIIDEQVALRRGLVGQETTGPGGCAMALRTIPAVLGYCDTLARVAPHAVLINFTNPAGIITQAITAHGGVRAVGVCDTPGGTIRRIGEFLGVETDRLGFAYGGLNHLGWISSIVVDGEERIGELLARFDELRTFDHSFGAFDTGLVQRIGCIPTEYLYYFYESASYVAGAAHAGTSRGEDVKRFNEALVNGVAKAFDGGDVHDAWAAYSRVMDARHDSYMRLDVEGEAQSLDPSDVADHGRLDEIGAIGGYEGVALRVIDGLSGARPASVIVNTRNGSSLDFLDPDDIVEVPALVDGRGVAPLANSGLTVSTQGLVMQVKEYERAVVEAAVTGDAELAALALALHPLVPGTTVARDMMREYRERHGRFLAYLQ